MMKVVGEEGTSLEDFVDYLKSEFMDAVYMQQNSFDEVDGSCSIDRQTYVFKKMIQVLGSTYKLEDKTDARTFFNKLRQNFIDWNYKKDGTPEFKDAEKAIDKTYAEKTGTLTAEVKALLKDGE